MAWEDNYNIIFNTTIQIEGNKEWRLSVEEHKKSGKVQMNCRIFAKAKEEGGYEGPTKNGFIIPVKSLEDIENMEKMFSNYFKEVKKFL